MIDQLLSVFGFSTFDLVQLIDPRTGAVVLEQDFSAAHPGDVWQLRLYDELAADFDGDGEVDGNDFLNWQRGFGSLSDATIANGDGNGDGNVAGDDLGLWQQHFPFQENMVSAASVNVPEPSSLALNLLALVLALAVGRHLGKSLTGRWIRISTFLVGALVVMPTVRADEDASPDSPAKLRDLQSDTWVATDAVGRRVATHAEVGPPRPDRWVGIFYFLWHGAHVNGGPWDNTRILNIDREAMQKQDSPLWGAIHAPHHWGESIFGHYVGDDKWVLRKHAQMLSDAGVDTLIFDTSNKVIYEKNYTALFDTLMEVRAAGNATPDVAFLTPFGDPGSTVQELYDKLYSRGVYQDLWFQWEGKPLILANKAQVDPALHEFFTFRRPQPSYFAGPTEANMWAWLEVSPQHVFHNDRGEKEQMAVGVAQNAVRDPQAPPIGDSRELRLGTLSESGALGRSFHRSDHSSSDSAPFNDGPNSVLWGNNFAEQWEHALGEDPRFIFVTGWNEWFGGRFDEFLGVKLPVMFVDTFDQEHSRDVEPMKGGYGDNYYYQMASYIRRYKGARPVPPASAPKTINLEGNFSQWSDVGPEYRDTIGDTAHRDHPGYNTVTRLGNTSGRNDFVLTKVARDEQFLYFYAKTREPITDFTDPDWMVLFLNTDRSPDTGWQGYDIAINRRMKDGSTSVAEHTGNGWNWQPKGEARFTMRGNELMLAVRRATLGLAENAAVDFEFKWADNFQLENNIDAFTVNGDSAPAGRFNYLYQAGSE